MKVDIKIVENVQGKLLNYLILQEKDKKVYINIGEKTLKSILELQMLELQNELQNEQPNENDTVQNDYDTH